MILFLYKAGRRGILESTNGPDEFFYGATGLARAGLDVATLDSDEIAALAGAADATRPVGAFWRLARRPLAAALPGFPSVIASHVFHPAVCARLAVADTIVATTTGFAYALALLKATGKLRARIVALAMGIFADTQPARQKALFGHLLRQIELIALSPAEAAFLRARLPGHTRISSIPFGVDIGFWTPGAEPSRPGEPYVFAIGNDLQRDWATLIDAWTHDLPKLKIVTGMPLPPLPANVEAIRGNWHKGGLSDESIRELYRGASLVVLPIKSTIQPSGQSACLQAMACARPVVISDFPGLWDVERLRDGETCFLAPSGDAGKLAAAVRGALMDPARTQALGLRARRLVEERFTSTHMARAFAQVLDIPVAA